MKKALFIFVFLFTSPLFSQVNKIKIKKEEALYKATLAGVDSGYVSLKKIIQEKKIKVSNEKDPIEIFSFEAAVINTDDPIYAQTFICKGSQFSDELIKELEKGAMQLRIKSILAYNSFNETIKLNDISITFIK